MTDDLISQAEALMGRPNGYAPSLITRIVGRLVAEIKRLRTMEQDTGEELTIAHMLGSRKANDRLKVLQDYVRRLEKEFLDHAAARICYESVPGMSDYWSWHDYPEEPCQMRPKQWFRDQAQAALEKIRRG